MKPAIFNTAMVRAILDGRKTQTRRVIDKRYEIQHLSELNAQGDKNEYPFRIIDNKKLNVYDTYDIYGCFKHYIKTPYKVGDVIYVRETFSEWLDWDTRSLLRVTYKASDEDCSGRWKPSIHMPKEYARLFLRVKDVRIERLNEISEDDAKAEGIEYWTDYVGLDDVVRFKDYLNLKDHYATAHDSFNSLWESIYGKDSFDNRYIWVIEFERISEEEAMS